MDYKTKSISRRELRSIAHYLRKVFGQPASGRFDVTGVFEEIPNLIHGVTTEIVDDNKLSKNNPAKCVPDFNGHFEIIVKEEVYEGACKGIGGYRAHLLHEICHVILFKLGNAPLLGRTYKEGELQAYESVEWQAKALCGELLIPFDDIEGKNVSQIMSEYGVSRDCAEVALKNLKTHHKF